MGWGGWGSVACGVYGSGFLVLIQNTVYYFFTLLGKLFDGFAVSSYWQNVFTGVVISRTAGGIQEAFTVRKVSFGTGVERTFPLHSPIIDKIEVERRGDVRRAKLYYLRNLKGKAAKI